ncbi:hypothetical protein DFH08DRAFT_826178 [Mycena albidolilacea]|uniref:Uncharacterized protein n=1 Tax=Mycena albidolilacea TaxID=1033008 RepID=A0AAD6Z1M4_9AGAR|nr:hypothetical protein DFH08DRAFT_826178 [Mycena albidolilacea]
MQLHASSALDCPRYAVQPLRCIFTLKVGEVHPNLDTPMPVVEHDPRRAVGVVAQDRYLVEEDLSPRLEIFVVQEEAQERAVAGGALRIPKDNRVLRSFGLGIRTGSRNAKKTDSNRRRQPIEGGWQKDIGNVDCGWKSFGWRQDSECKSGAGLWGCEMIVTSNKNQMANYAHHQAIRGIKIRRPMQLAIDNKEKLEWDLVQNLAFTGCRNTQNFFRDRLQRGELVEGSHFCVDPLMCPNLPWFSLVHGARSVLLRPTKCQGDNDTIPTESSLGSAVVRKGERKARESKLVVSHE